MRAHGDSSASSAGDTFAKASDKARLTVANERCESVHLIQAGQGCGHFAPQRNGSGRKRCAKFDDQGLHFVRLTQGLRAADPDLCLDFMKQVRKSPYWKSIAQIGSWRVA
jgi:hypothetical protein